MTKEAKESFAIDPTLKSVLAVDPGYATGIAAGVFTDTEPLRLTAAKVLTYEEMAEFPYEFQHDPTYVVVEDFQLRSGNSFTADLHAPRVLGILDVTFGIDGVRYRQPSDKGQVPDKVLKSHGLWKTGADVGWEDGRDANDAIIHLLGFVAFDLGHIPTLREYFR